MAIAGTEVFGCRQILVVQMIFNWGVPYVCWWIVTNSPWISLPAPGIRDTCNEFANKYQVTSESLVSVANETVGSGFRQNGTWMTFTIR